MTKKRPGGEQFADFMEAIDFDPSSMTEREEAIADANFKGGKVVGYSEGFDEGEQKAVDLTIAGAFLIALLAGAIGFAVGAWGFAL